MLESILQSKKVYVGFATRTLDKETWPLKVKFTYYDSSTGSFEGSLEWTSLDSIHWIKGKISGNQLIFKETDFVKKGNASLDTTNILAFDKSTSKLTGYWHGVNSGEMIIDIE